MKKLFLLVLLLGVSTYLLFAKLDITVSRAFDNLMGILLDLPQEENSTSSFYLVISKFIQCILFFALGYGLYKIYEKINNKIQAIVIVSIINLILSCLIEITNLFYIFYKLLPAVDFSNAYFYYSRDALIDIIIAIVLLVTVLLNSISKPQERFKPDEKLSRNRFFLIVILGFAFSCFIFRPSILYTSIIDINTIVFEDIYFNIDIKSIALFYLNKIPYVLGIVFLFVWLTIMSRKNTIKNRKIGYLAIGYLVVTLISDFVFMVLFVTKSPIFGSVLNENETNFVVLREPFYILIIYGIISILIFNLMNKKEVIIDLPELPL